MLDPDLRPSQTGREARPPIIRKRRDEMSKFPVFLKGPENRLLQICADSGPMSGETNVSKPYPLANNRIRINGGGKDESRHLLPRFDRRQGPRSTQSAPPAPSFCGDTRLADHARVHRPCNGQERRPRGVPGDDEGCGTASFRLAAFLVGAHARTAAAGRG